MSLHDVNKHQLDRSDPQPNHTDRLNDGSIKAHKTISTHYDAGADTNPGYIQMQNKQILANDGTTNIGLYGYNAALGKWGFFTTKTGTDVTTNTDLTKFIFNSNQDIFKIADQNTVNMSSGFTNFPIPLTASSSNNFTMNSITYTHNLGYVPQIVLSRQGQSVGSYGLGAPGMQDIWVDGAGTGSSGLVIANVMLYVIASTTTVVFTLQGFWSNSGSAGYTLPPFIGGLIYKFFLLQESAAP